MAFYSELFDFKVDTGGVTLRNKVSIAATKKAQAFLDAASPTVAQVNWATLTLQDPLGTADELLNYVVAANSSLSIAAIEGANDAAIQANVDTAVDAIVAGGSG